MKAVFEMVVEEKMKLSATFVQQSLKQTNCKLNLEKFKCVVFLTNLYIQIISIILGTD